MVYERERGAVEINGCEEGARENKTSRAWN